MFMSFEGVDGSGKSTQAKKLAKYLRARGREVTLTREPGGSAGAEEIRRLVLEGDSDRWSPYTELLLFNAARRDHCEKTINPALMRGEVVITDRFVDSTRAFQTQVDSATPGVTMRSVVDAIHKLVIDIEPELTLLIDLDAEEGLRRSLGRGSTEVRFEGMGLKFQQNVRRAYLEIAAEFPGRCRIINGLGSEDEVFARICDVVLPRLGL